MNRVFLGVAAVAAGLAGCASPARYVERGPDSGVVAIPANTNDWPSYNRRAAIAKIEEHLGANYEILEEREVPVGQATFNNQQPAGDGTWNATTTLDMREWHIAYRRKAGPTTYAGPVPPVSPTPPGMVRPAGLSGGAGNGVRPAGGAMPAGGPGVTNAGGVPGRPGSGPGLDANVGTFIPVGGR
jgi:hypothetical protein